MTGHLLRRHAPIADEVWELLDNEAKERLTVALGARKFVDVAGPLGWQHSATNLGRVGPSVALGEGVVGRSRRVLPLTELRADFTLPLAELTDATRGAADVDLSALDLAAHQIASAENAAVFHGFEEAGIVGIIPSSPHEPLVHEPGATGFEAVAARAVATLKSAGIGGPYALALCPSDWTAVIEATDRGYPLLRHLGEVLDGPIEWIPGIRESVVLSTRGGDWLLELGEDLSLGYAAHTGESVGLYLEETLSFRVATPEAAVVIH
ncbi:family 1 encapsulin nanocompartment shell protein [Gryllotalpicola koreensis]|uniref:Type 1 encapsulin shell protein n=1 Tax=Gryllotalpicola koreensis TaxID=993086 RepID=A0ABP8A971_9MICO